MLTFLMVCSAILQGVFAQESCTDIPPTCEQLKEQGKCSETWMASGNYCAKTCESCDQEDDFKCGLEGSCVFGVCTTTTCVDSDCNARESNIQGDLVLLDVNSQSYNAGPNHPPQVTNPADCCDQCKQTSGCNAWVFCSNRDGCGSGCKDYVNSLSDSSKGFGQFGGCSGDKWPWLMCSLKKVSDINSPEEQGAEDGWVSGVVTSQ